MEYVKGRDLFGSGPSREIPCLTGPGAPTTATVGAVGCLYMDTDTGDLYKCTAAADGVNTWSDAEVASLYYIPKVTDNGDGSVTFAWTPSVTGFPTPKPTTVELPAGSSDSGENVDLTGYATEQYVQEYAQPKGNYLTEVPEGYAKTEDIPTKAEDIGALPSTYTPPDQTAEQVGADPTGTAESKVSEHNTDTASHNDLRQELKALSDRLTAFFDSDDTTLDELSEIVAYITNNKTLIESITTSKVNVADIIDNLTTNVANKPLSAAQGVVLKGLIDTVSNSLSNYQPKGDYALNSAIPTKVSQLQNDAGYLTQHQDISGKADKTGLTLGIHTDGLVYLFVDGVPMGGGIELASGGISGYVADDGTIVLTGLEDGEHTIAYEMNDGTLVTIGKPVVDNNVYYSVTNTLTNCTNGNSATQAVEGGSYSATISANSGYELSSVVVTMGGTDISSSAVSGGTISIASVTGNIVITAVAVEVTTEPTNILTSGTYEVSLNKRWSGSGASYEDCDGMISVLIPMQAVVNKTIWFKGFTLTTASSQQVNWLSLNADKSECGRLSTGVSSTSGRLWESPHLTNNNGICSVPINTTSFTGINDAGYLMTNMAVANAAITEIPDTMIMTIDQELV